MGVKENYIFRSSNWAINNDLLNKTNNILLRFKKSIELNKIPIFSLIDTDKDIDEIVQNANFFTFDNKLTDFVLIGTGGSSLGADALIQAYSNHNLNKKINFHILDTLDSNSVSKILNSIQPNTAKFLAISKSGKTTETIALLLLIIDWLIANDIKVKESVMVMCENINDKENDLIRIVKQYSLKAIQHENIGGRFSVFSSTGLLPATIMGIDPYSIRDTARNTLRNIFDDNSFILSSSVFSETNNLSGKLNCIIHYGDALAAFINWYKQLWNESLGKDSKGSFLLTAKGSIDQHSQLQMWLDGPNIANYTFIKVANIEGYKIPTADKDILLSGLTFGKIQNIMADSTFSALKENNRSVRIISIPDITVETVTELMVKFILEVLVVAELMQVDPYTQNAVEKIKNNVSKRLK
jgi:glucose-6-phosphate isomerase